MTGALMAGTVVCGSCGNLIPASVRRCTTCGSSFVGVALDTSTGIFVPPDDLRAAAPNASPAGSGTGAWLEVLRGGAAGDVVLLVGPMTVAGRAADVDLLLADVSVSRRHARFVGDGTDGVVVLEDLGSLNGTYVNGQRVDRVELLDADVVRIGRFQLRYRITEGA